MTRDRPTRYNLHLYEGEWVEADEHDALTHELLAALEAAESALAFAESYAHITRAMDGYRITQALEGARRALAKARGES